MRAAITNLLLFADAALVVILVGIAWPYRETLCLLWKEALTCIALATH
jgi:hypothetical protein